MIMIFYQKAFAEFLNKKYFSQDYVRLAKATNFI